MSSALFFLLREHLPSFLIVSELNEHSVSLRLNLPTQASKIESFRPSLSAGPLNNLRFSAVFNAMIWERLSQVVVCPAITAKNQSGDQEP